ncbi:hypothetical protein BDW68DRAFT_194785 [Aspergillus falconensis]
MNSNPDSEAGAFALQAFSNTLEPDSAQARESSFTHLLNDPFPSDAERDSQYSRGSSISRQSYPPSPSPSPSPPSQEASCPNRKDAPSFNKTTKFLMGKDNWLWEIISLILSAACVVAMVAILFDRQDTALAAWHLSIAPNTVISVLATVSKTSLLLPVAESISQLKWLHFDNGTARRLADFDLYNNASQGPLGALFFVFRLPLSLGALGAVVTIVALAFDPFAQQLVSYQSRQAAMHNETASFRTSQAYESGAYYTYQGGIEDYTDFTMQGAIYNGLFGSRSPRAFTCPTSHCAWPDNSSYTLLGVTGSCENVTLSSVNTCKFPMSSRDGDCNITTPGGFNLTSRRRHQSATFQFTRLNTTGTPSWGETADLINFAVWRLTGFDLSAFDVHECRLSLSAYLYRNVSVSQNTMHIQDQVPVPLEPVGELNNGLNWFRPSVGEFTPEVQFALHAADSSKIQDVLSEIFIGVEATTLWGEPTTAIADVLIAGNLSRIVENIAWGMTERMRTGPNSTIAEGTAYQAETYIAVNWPWITLPVLVVLGAAVLLVCSILANSRHKAALWKSSNLAVLLHSVQGVERDHGSPLPFSPLDDAPLASVEAWAERIRAVKGDNMVFIPRA